MATALATATVSSLAVPLAAHASESSAVRTDAVAVQAVDALTDLQRTKFAREGSPLAAVSSLDDTLAAIAGDIAFRLGVDPARLKKAWRSADREHQVALLAAFSQLGVPYRTNASKPGEGFDCSGLTSYAWGQAGFLLQRLSSAQINAAAPRTELTAQAGDLVQYPGHVMMWLGVDRAVVHSPYSGRDVEVDNASSRRKLNFGDPTG